MTEILSSIGYSGTVTVKLGKSKPQYLSNAGFKPLWDLLAMAVAGYTVGDKVPKYFSISSRPIDATDNLTDQECLLTKLPFLGTVWGDAAAETISDTSTSTRFTVTVTKNNRRLKIRDDQVAVLQMFNRKGELLAEVVDNYDRVIAKSHNGMVTGVDATYEWIMTFRNT